MASPAAAAAATATGGRNGSGSGSGSGSRASRPQRSSKFQWAPWAYNQCLTAAFMIFTGAIVALIYPHPALGAANLVLSLIIMGFEYLAPSITSWPTPSLAVVRRSLWVRTAVYAGSAALAILTPPTSTGGVCMACGALTYAWAAFQGESGDPPPKRGRR